VVVAVNVTILPEQTVSPGLAEILTDGVIIELDTTMYAVELLTIFGTAQE
jgi:hypothetical protein